jgi:large subunit ribosomal protein L25
MSRPTLNAAVRTEHGKNVSRRLRAAGRIPAVVYGKKKQSVSLSLDPKAVLGVLDGAQGRNTTFDLQIEGEKGVRLGIIKEYQVHPWKRTLRHVDIQELQAEVPVTLKVPFLREGASPIEKLGGRVRFHRTHVLVKCLPIHIPVGVSVDMTVLADESAALNISEVTAPADCELLYKSDFKLLQIQMPKAEEEVEEEGEEGEGGEGDAAAETSEE